MNFQQLRSVREAVRCGFNLTDVAARLNTSQPGVSRQIRELEDELGIAIFVRAGKRLTGFTPPGEAVLPIVASIAFDTERDRNLQAIDAGHLFEVNLTRLGLRRGAWLRSYVYAFIESFAPPLTRAAVDRALRAPAGARLD